MGLFDSIRKMFAAPEPGSAPAPTAAPPPAPRKPAFDYDDQRVPTGARDKIRTILTSLAEVEGSLDRLGVDFVDLYYIHWPRTGWDMRPSMEGLERARAEGKIGAVGVSNFSVAEMEQVAEVGTIDAHQLGYNLIWRYAEEDVIPWCRAHGVKVVVYSTMAHGILTGKFGRDPGLREGDQRHALGHERLGAGQAPTGSGTGTGRPGWARWVSPT